MADEPKTEPPKKKSTPAQKPVASPKPAPAVKPAPAPKPKPAPVAKPSPAAKPAPAPAAKLAPSVAPKPANEPSRGMSSPRYERVNEIAALVIVTFFAVASFFPALEYGRRLIRLPLMYQIFGNLGLVLDRLLYPTLPAFIFFFAVLLAIYGIAKRQVWGAIFAVLVSVSPAALLVWSSGTGALTVVDTSILSVGVGLGVLLWLSYRRPAQHGPWYLWASVVVIVTLAALYAWGAYSASLDGSFRLVSPSEFKQGIPFNIISI